jgi:V/A-type H+-transporting ATPase subunit F
VNTSNIAIIGDKDSVLSFKAVGVSVFPTTDVEEARKIFRELIRGDYAVIYITEQLAEGLDDEIQKVAFQPLPSVVLIPNSKGSLGFGSRRIREVVKKAVGADILADSEEG